MKAYVCMVCGFLYDEESADIGPDGKILTFGELNEEWTCPICSNKPDLFRETKSERIHDLANTERQS